MFHQTQSNIGAKSQTQATYQSWPIFSSQKPDFDKEVLIPLRAHQTAVEAARQAEVVKVVSTAAPLAKVRHTAPEQPKTEVVAPPQPQEDVWTVLADCETGDGQVGPPYSLVWNYNGPSGFDGAFQFLPSTWSKMGTGYAFAYQAPPEIQRSAAQRLLAAAGWGSWPSCSKRMKEKGYI